MSIYSEKAKDLFLQGYNCSQAVAGAFCDAVGLDEKTILALSSSFGGGMGRMREVCGALSGAFLIMGAAEGNYPPNDHAAKAFHYQQVQSIAARFRQIHGTILCRELLAGTGTDSKPIPDQRTPEYYQKRPCSYMVETAAEILEEWLLENKYLS